YLNHAVRPHYDSSDGEQSVLADFLVSSLHEHDFTTQSGMLAFLRQMTKNKMAVVYRRFCGAARRNVQRQVRLPPDLPDREPTPALVAEYNDAWNQWLAGLPPVEQQVIILYRGGFPNREIAQELNLTTHQVRRILLKLMREAPLDSH